MVAQAHVGATARVVRFGVPLNPPVIGSASLDRGLAEWHPVGCAIAASDLSDSSNLSGIGTPAKAPPKKRTSERSFLGCTYRLGEKELVNKRCSIYQ